MVIEEPLSLKQNKMKRNVCISPLEHSLGYALPLSQNDKKLYHMLSPYLCILNCSNARIMCKLCEMSTIMHTEPLHWISSQEFEAGRAEWIECDEKKKKRNRYVHEHWHRRYGYRSLSRRTVFLLKSIFRNRFKSKWEICECWWWQYPANWMQKTKPIENTYKFHSPFGGNIMCHPCMNELRYNVTHEIQLNVATCEQATTTTRKRRRRRRRGKNANRGTHCICLRM